MRRKGILALALAATLVVGVSAAFAAKTYTTHIVFLGNDGPSLQDQTLFGDLNTNRKCRSARLMGLFKQTSNGLKELDLDFTSLHGAWALRADLTGTPDLTIKATREKRKHGRVVCKPAKITLSAGSPAYPRVR